jgi:hypothetical protein
LQSLLVDFGQVDVVPGNHDDSHLVAQYFGASAPRPRGVGSVWVERPSIMRSGLRMMLVDTSVDGHDYGELPTQLLNDLHELAHSGTPMIIAMHHPPIDGQVPCLNSISLRQTSCDALRQALLNNGHVIAVLAGHYHKCQFSIMNQSCRVIVAPSVAPALSFDYIAGHFKTDLNSPVSALLHDWDGSTFQTHLVSVAQC